LASRGRVAASASLRPTAGSKSFPAPFGSGRLAPRWSWDTVTDRPGLSDGTSVRVCARHTREPPKAIRHRGSRLGRSRHKWDEMAPTSIHRFGPNPSCVAQNNWGKRVAQARWAPVAPRPVGAVNAAQGAANTRQRRRKTDRGWQFAGLWQFSRRQSGRTAKVRRTANRQRVDDHNCRPRAWQRRRARRARLRLADGAARSPGADRPPNTPAARYRGIGTTVIPGPPGTS
jgi:hypothetical protein